MTAMLTPVVAAALVQVPTKTVDHFDPVAGQEAAGGHRQPGRVDFRR